MVVLTKSPGYASALLPEELTGRLAPVKSLDPGLEALVASVFGNADDLLGAPQGVPPWGPLLLSEFSPTSQYDQLIGLARSEFNLPDRTICLAGSGQDFHGFKGRSWAAVPGNLHLAVHLAPRCTIDRFEVAFTLLAALSVAEAVAELPALTVPPRIKWVNDILLDDAKVGGVLAYTQSQGKKVTSAILGIGLNVDATPEVESTPFVPRVASVRDFLPLPDAGLQGRVLSLLLGTLDRNYRTLLADGVSPLLERYRERSLVIGEKVTICTDVSDRAMRIVAEGRVARLGENLELFLEHDPQPIFAGRLALGRATTEVYDRAAGVPEGAPAHAISGGLPPDDGCPP